MISIMSYSHNPINKQQSCECDLSALSVDKNLISYIILYYMHNQLKITYCNNRLKRQLK